ncbi:MAG: hypothetical protein AAF694_10585 [Bacteroidota bacterium]
MNRHSYFMTSQELYLTQQEESSFWYTGSNWQWFLLICLVYASSSFINQTFILSDSLFYNSYGEQMAYERIEQILDFQAKWEWIGYAVLPLFISIKLMLVALCLLAGAIWEEYKIGFRKIWSMVLRAELGFAIASLITVGYLALFAELHRLEDLQTFHNFSLLAFVPIGEDINAWYLYPLRVISIFEVLYWVILVKGMQAISKRGFEEIFGLVGRSYGLGLLLWVMLVIFLKLNMGI